MFGHDNQHHDNNQPAPDGALAHEGQESTAPQVTDDTAGTYLDDVPPVTSTVPQPTDDSEDTSGLGSSPDVPAAATTPAAPVSPDTDALLDLKQQALQQLTPLVGHLDQSPEEKFRTTMMMIQAADNHELIKTAYEAAQQITDEKVRAQALLDIVNEINYFTHNNSPAAAA